MEYSSLRSYRMDEKRKSLRELLASLPETYREVLVLHYFGGMKSGEIARATGASPAAIRMRLSRARAQLKKEMAVMMDITLDRQRLSAGFTFRIVEAVKRIRIHPTPRVAELPWGLSLAMGIIIAVLSVNPQMSIQDDMEMLTGSLLSSEERIMRTGEIPVDVLKNPQMLALASIQNNSHDKEFTFAAPQKIQSSALQNETSFTDVAKEAGLREVNRFKSLTPVWGDYDNDGDLDLYVTHGGWADMEMEADIFYRNNGDGTFTDVTDEAGLDKNNGDGRHAGFLDYDGDGYMDLYVSDDNFIDGNNVSRILLYHNNGDGTFTDETKDAGIRNMIPNYSWSSTFADFDNDGDLDMYFAVGWKPNVFYENEGDRTFTDATMRAGLGDPRGAMNMASGDYDDDGDIDIYVSNGTGKGKEPVVFYRNNGDGTFTDVAEEAGVSEERNGRAVAFFDYDNDGDLDIFAGEAAGGTVSIRLYRNNGDGTFTDVAREAGIPVSSPVERLTVGDYDNDGYMDVFIMDWNQPRKLYHNNGDGTFSELAAKAGVSTLGGKSGGCSFVDYDNDGDLDLYVSNFKGYSALYRSDGNDNHWLHIKLVGTETNRDGVGARVVVKAGNLSMTREINPGCAGARNSLTAHFGLGKNTMVDSIEIRWPSGPVIGEDGKVVPGRIEVFKDVPADRFIMIKEGSGEIVEVETARAVQPQEKLLNTWGRMKIGELYQNFPNPSNPETWIPFRLSKPEHVTIKIYSSAGQLIKTLDLGQIPPGSYLDKGKAAYWDGRNEAGEPVASDVYFYAMQAGEESTDPRKMVLAR